MARLLLVSNRLPVTVKVEHGEVLVTRSAGGLATGMKGPHERSGGLWLGYPGDVSRLQPDQRAALEARLEELRYVPLHLSPGEVSRFYEGFSNGVLWPLFHYMLDRVPLGGERDWESYRRVNERFADLVAAHHREGDIVWVHDYQLMLVPGLLRKKIPNARIGFFLHIPFPSSEVFRILPWRTQLLEGLLGADLIGFHTLSYLRHFASALLLVNGLEANVDRVFTEGREVRLGAFPMGIDAAALSTLAGSPEVAAEAQAFRQPGQRILLGIDRLDYTKGIPRRLLALERLLEREPSLRGKVRLVQVTVPSRTNVEAYQGFRSRVDELVGRINGAYATVHSVPIHSMYRSFNERQLASLYRAADVMLVTPLRDGMNLVAKEFVASRTDEDGVLVLSELAGAASELADALLVNPYDIGGVAAALKRALTMPENERRQRMQNLRQHVLEHDVHGWAQSFLSTLEEQSEASHGRALGATTSAALEVLTTELRQAPRLTLLLDYDGTLVRFARAPDQAAPDPDLRHLLTALARRPGTRVHVVSGRSRDALERWLGDLPISLAAEHGFWTRDAEAREWRARKNIPSDWNAKFLPLLRQFVARTPGALLEEKNASLTFHYRMADPEFGVLQAKDLRLHLGDLLKNTPVEILPGDKTVEIRPMGAGSGALVASLLERAPPGARLVALGDDLVDEEMFAALPAPHVAMHVGPRPSRAPYRLSGPAAARAFLQAIAAD
ncbi:bifunctional alpha,alpha-trehalose-phosphate synthase (UDP-forming)/trehalose-phosphatase [Polyangium jinanense]|uniref:Glucosylglycerol-phosphate synthase n=1 Tax=Polyangium jinanense TaxID=2829994 RepID=A0A9X3X624_9BACT|nr:bifunctional alpha,alpha-trehalose-phosphate synthase (UDP-forming)/trehalose-phosphatase [Polyangium jinanense]MDC3956172.1 bifunctional alpha,alpha-trehalose-phosphate synthase (UDP-forming)/trehalose-phosphatase [Polyangium jinanense]MDC3982993.1 bifunctional alpha,alpha-trehalose-phosphate synthase (UDP-forming)/trehalose-phosphatase [Polyangium jinanense]